MKEKNDYFKNDELENISKEVFESTYCYQGESVDGMFKRVAANLASIEKENKEEIADKFYNTLKDFKFIPAGRILSNAGADYKATSYINCFVSGFRGEDQDSMESISAELARQALILKSEGGYGFCCSTLRPRGENIKGIGSASPGMVEFLNMWDTQSAVITMGSGKEQKNGKKKIRKGAQMVTAYIWHPDIKEFITAKQTPNRLTKFNMSVLLTDKFLKAVENKESWDLIFPNIEEDKQLYKTYWNGDIENWLKVGGTIKVYETLPASELYDLIMTSTYNRAEPGCLFIDTVNKMNNLKEIETINSSNPCGEQPLPVGGACLLGSINLTQFINENGDNWDYSKLEEHLPNIIRMLDNVIELTYLPLPEQYEEIQNKRRIGVGVTGLGSALMMMQIPYGSPKALQIIEEYFNYQTNKLYQLSAELAEEKGAFPLWNYSNFLESGFIKSLSLKTLNLIKEKGLRNSHLTSIQPTGNTGILAKNVSGGLEPVFMVEYIRTHGVDVLPKGLPEHTEWKDSYIEGDTTFKTYTLDGTKYKWSPSGNYVKESLVEDYAVKYLKNKGIWDNLANYAKTTEQLSVSEHLETMKIISKYVDAAMSKTINLPKDYPFEDFKNLYLEGWRTGTIKGITTYRAGTMSAVLKSTTEEEKPKIITERPIELECKVVQFKNEKKDWIAFVGILNDTPYEIFTGPKDLDIFPIPSSVTEGTIIKVKVGDDPSRYDFRYVDSYGYTNTLGGLSRIFDKEYWNYARLMSALLREQVSPEKMITIIEGLNFSNKSMTNWKSGVIRSFKPFVKDGTKSHGEICTECGQETIVYEAGCKICKNCGNSKCN